MIYYFQGSKYSNLICNKIYFSKKIILKAFNIFKSKGKNFFLNKKL